MSHTDKTKPWNIRIAEHHPRAVHDHRNGICDLPDDPRTPTFWSVPYCCFWSDENLHYASCCHGCGCRLCTDHDGHIRGNRRRRHRQRQMLATMLNRSDWDYSDKGGYRF